MWLHPLSIVTTIICITLIFTALSVRFLNNIIWIKILIWFARWSGARFFYSFSCWEPAALSNSQQGTTFIDCWSWYQWQPCLEDITVHRCKWYRTLEIRSETHTASFPAHHVHPSSMTPSCCAMSPIWLLRDCIMLRKRAWRSTIYIVCFVYISEGGDLLCCLVVLRDGDCERSRSLCLRRSCPPSRAVFLDPCECYEKDLNKVWRGSSTRGLRSFPILDSHWVISTPSSCKTLRASSSS